MLQLIAPNGTVLDLNPDTRINIVLNSSIFEPEVLAGSFSYAFDLPATPTNEAFFSFKNYVEAKQTRNTEFPGFRLKSGTSVIACKLVLRAATPLGFKINLLAASGQFAADLKETKLKDLPMEDVLVPITFNLFIHAYMGFFGDGPAEGDLITTTLVYDDLPDYPQNNIVFYVKFRTDGPTTIQDLVDGINNPVYPQPFVLGTSYLENDVVVDENGIYWEAFEDNTGFPLVDESEGGKWILIGARSAWHVYRFTSYSTPWRYADPYHDGRIVAEATEGEIPFTNSFIVKDIRTSLPDLMNPTGSFSNIGSSYGFDVFDSNIDPAAFFASYATLLDTHMQEVNSLPSTDPEARFVYPCIVNEDFSSNEDYMGVVNYYDEGAFKFNTITLGQRFRYAISPQIYVKEVFSKIFSFLGLRYNSEFFDDPSHAAKLLYSTLILSQVSVLYTPSDGYRYFDSFRNKWNIGEAMPDAFLNEFLNAARTFFYWGIFFDFRTNSIELKTLDDVLSDTPVDWSYEIPGVQGIDFPTSNGYLITYRDSARDEYRNSLIVSDLLFPDKFTILQSVPTTQELPINEAVFGSVRYVSSEDKYYAFAQADDGSVGWVLKSHNSVGFRQGEGDIRVEVNADSPLMFRGLKKSGVNWEIPKVKEEAYSKYNLGSQRTSLRFMNYLGMQEDSTSALYPMASSGVKNYAGEPTSVETSARFENEDGLCKTVGKKWIDFITTTQNVDVPVYLDEVALAKIDFSKPVRVRNTVYLIRKVNLAMPLDSAPSTFTLCPIR